MLHIITFFNLWQSMNSLAAANAKQEEIIRSLEDKIRDDESKFQSRLRDAQSKAEKMIDEEVRGGIAALEKQHQKALQDLKEAELQERQGELSKLREELERGFAKNLHTLQLQHELEKEELLRTERESRIAEQEALKSRFAESKTSLEKDFKLAKESISSKMTSEIEKLKLKISDLEKAEFSSSELAKKLQKEKLSKENELAALKQEMTTALNNAKREFEDKLSKQLVAHTNSLQKAEIESNESKVAREKEWNSLMEAKESELSKAKQLLSAKEMELEQQRILFEMSGSKQNKETREAMEIMRLQIHDECEERIRQLQAEFR